MIMKETTLCPIKGTNVYLSVCEKCTYSKAECEAARQTRLKANRRCIECQDYGNTAVCEACLDTSTRDRPGWRPGEAKEFVMPVQLPLF